MVTFEPVCLISAHQGLYDALSAAGLPHVLVKDSGGATLADLPLGVGVVNPTTGQLSLGWGAGQNGLATGQAATVEVLDFADVKYMTLTAVQSNAPVADAAAMTTLDIIAGAPVSGVSFTIG
jgi:hypothetical protein